MTGMAVRFIGSSPCGEGVATFRFTRPDGYGFSAGQFFTLELETREGVQAKHFTHANAPHMSGIELTTRLTGSAFKDALLALREGQEASITGPKGRLGVPQAATAIGFLAGGVGITPARSIIADVAHTHRPLDVVLVYGNRDETCIPYGAEFRAIAETNPWFRYLDVLQDAPEGWQGERGFITAETVRRYDARLLDRHWIIAGPPPMIAAMQSVVNELGISPEHVFYELFAGYGDDD